MNKLINSYLHFSIFLFSLTTLWQLGVYLNVHDKQGYKNIFALQGHFTLELLSCVLAYS